MWYVTCTRCATHGLCNALRMAIQQVGTRMLTFCHFRHLDICSLSAACISTMASHSFLFRMWSTLADCVVCALAYTQHCSMLCPTSTYMHVTPTYILHIYEHKCILCWPASRERELACESCERIWQWWQVLPRLGSSDINARPCHVLLVKAPYWSPDHSREPYS